MENPQQHVAPAAAIASGFITDAGPQFWKVALISGKVIPPLKTTLFERGEMIFGPHFFLCLSNICMLHALFAKKRDQNWPSMTVAAAQRKHCHVYGGHQFNVLYPVSAHSNREKGKAMC